MCLMKQATHRLSAADRQLLLSLLERDGDVHVARRFGVSRMATLRCAAGLKVRRGTLVLVQSGLEGKTL